MCGMVEIDGVGDWNRSKEESTESVAVGNVCFDLGD